MISIRRQLMGLGFIAASSVVAMGAAHAMTGQTNIKVDGGPLGELEMSGGMGGYGYMLSNKIDGVNSMGTNFDALYLELQKTTGVLQFTIKAGGDNGGGYVAGLKPLTVSFPDNLSSDGKRGTSLLYQGYVTIAPPNAPVTVSAGVLSGLEGYESSTAWNNVSLFTSALSYTETGNQIGVNADITEGPASLLVQFGDNGSSHVFNTLELLGTYNINSNNALNLFATIKTGKTGVNADSSNPAGINSNVGGAYYSWTSGNLNLVPEVQYIYVKPSTKAGITSFSSNFGAALFGDYSFANTPYSLGGWAAYDKAIGSGLSAYGLNNDETLTVAISPTWQYKYVYARLNGAVVTLLNHPDLAGSNWASTKRTQFIAAVDTGFVF